MSDEIIEMHTLFSGNVQGVGFRYTAAELAKRLGVKGSVRNLSDGSVEIFAHGAKQQLDQFIHHLKDEFSDNIRKVNTEYNKPTKTFTDFKIEGTQVIG